MALLELRDVEARYGPVRALAGVSLAVDEGQIVTVLGANGAGKTTTLRAISGMVRRTGEITFEGKPLGRRGPEAVARLGVAHVPEGRGTFAELSVEENLKLGAYTRRGGLDGEVERMSGYFPWIGERLGQHAGTLSGGEQQMLALARALMSRPRLLLLDEPSLGLAPLVTQEIFRIVRELNEEEGLTVLVVEQNAAIALEVASRAYVLEVGKVAVSGTSEELARDESVRKSYLGYSLEALVAEFFQQVVAGLATGSIYASLALALVLIHRATGVINFAQGEMAMFTTYIAWTLTANHGWSYWPAFVATLVFAFGLGLGVHRVVIHPVERSSVLTIVIMTIGLVLVFNGLASLIWSAEIRSFPSPFPNETWQIGGVSISQQDVGTFAVVLVLVALLWAFFQFTKTGLALRASALNPEASRLVGVRVSWMLAIGWGLAALLGAVSGMLAAPTLFLDPNMMQATLIYAFAAAVLGGIDSPVGAVAGGLILGVGLNLLSSYVDFVGADLRLPVALLIILVVLLVRPAGLFGKPVVRRV